MLRKLRHALFPPPRPAAHPEYKGRNLSEFKGSILSMGGTEEELKRIQDRNSNCFKQTDSIKDLIYTINYTPNQGADMLADVGSIQETASLPDKRFDIVYFDGISNTVNLVSAFHTAARVLKDDGILLFTGGVSIETRNNPHPIIEKINPTTLTTESFVDFEKMLTEAGFLEYIEVPDPFSAYAGTRWIASKSSDLNLQKKCETTPALNAIIQDLFTLESATVAKYFDQDKQKVERPARKFQI